MGDNSNDWQYLAMQAYLAKKEREQQEKINKDKAYLEEQTAILIPIANRILGTESYELLSIELYGRPTPVVTNYSHDLFFRAARETGTLVAIKKCLRCGQWVESFYWIDSLEKVGEALADECEWDYHGCSSPHDKRNNKLQECIEEIIDKKVGRI